MTLKPSILVGLTLLCCACSASPASPSGALVVTPEPETPTTPTLVEHFMQHQTRVWHEQALRMPVDLSTDVLDRRPCSVTFTTRTQQESRRLTYDKQGHLAAAEITTTSTTSGRVNTTSERFRYSSAGYIDEIFITPSQRVTYDVTDGVPKAMTFYGGDSGDLTLVRARMKIVFDEAARTVTLNAVEGMDHLALEGRRATYTFDAQGHLIAYQGFAQMDDKARWIYTTSSDGELRTIEHTTGERAVESTTHTLNGRVLVRSVKRFKHSPESGRRSSPERTDVYRQDPLDPTAADGIEGKPSQERTYVYKDDALVSASTINARDTSTLSSTTYSYACK